MLAQGKISEAQAVARDLLGRDSLRCEGFLLQSKVAAARNDWKGARQKLDHAVNEFPEDREAREARCRLLFEHGTPEEAEWALRERVEYDPMDAAAHHNLGTVHLRLGRYRQAASSYQESLRLRPGHVETAVGLRRALEAMK